jgi:protein-tyrosine phosphatase
MREVVPSLLWIGNAFDTRDAKRLLDNKIAAVIDLAIEEPTAVLPRELVYCRFPLIDGQGNSPALVEAAINTAVTLVNARFATLISCGGGMSRSPAIAAAVLSRINHISPGEAMKQVAATGPHDVTPLFWQAIVEVLAKMTALPTPTRSVCEGR